MNFLNLGDDAARAAASLGIDLGSSIQKGNKVLVKGIDGVKNMSIGAFNAMLNSRAGSLAAPVAAVEDVATTSRKLYPRLVYDHPPMRPTGELGRFPHEGAYQMVEVPSIVKDVDDLQFVGNQIGTKSGNPVFSTAKGDYDFIPQGKSRTFSGVAPTYASSMEEITARENARKVAEALGGSNRLRTSAQEVDAARATLTYSTNPELPTQFIQHIVPDVKLKPSQLGQAGNLSTSMAEKYQGIPTINHGATRNIPGIDETMARTNAMLSMADSSGRVGAGGHVPGGNNVGKLATYATDPVRLSDDIDLAQELSFGTGQKTNLTVRDDGTGSLSMLDRILGKGRRGVKVTPGKDSYQVTFAGSSPATGGNYDPNIARLTPKRIGATSAKITYGDGGELAVPFGSVEGGQSGGHQIFTKSLTDSRGNPIKQSPNSLVPITRNWTQKDQMFTHLGDNVVYQDAGVNPEGLKDFVGYTSIGPKGANGVEVPLTRRDVIAITQDAMPGQMPSSARLAQDDIVSKAAYYRQQQKDQDFGGKNLASSIIPDYKGRLEYAQPLAPTDPSISPISRAVPVLEPGTVRAANTEKIARRIMGDSMSIPPSSLNTFSNDMDEIMRKVFEPTKGERLIKDIPNAAVGISDVGRSRLAASEYASKQVADASRQIETVGKKVNGRTQPVSVAINGKSYNPLPMGEYEDAGRALGDKGSGVGKGDLSDYYRKSVAGVEDGGEFSVPPAWEGEASPVGGIRETIATRNPNTGATRYTQVPDTDHALAQKFGGQPVEYQIASTLPGDAEALPFSSGNNAQREAARRVEAAMADRVPTDKEVSVLNKLLPQVEQQHRPSVRVDNSGLASQRALSFQDTAARTRVAITKADATKGWTPSLDDDYDITLTPGETRFADEMDNLAIYEQQQRDRMNNWSARNDEMDIVPEPAHARLAGSKYTGNAIQETIEAGAIADNRLAVNKLSNAINGIRERLGMGAAPGVKRSPTYTKTGVSLPANGGRTIW